MTKSVEHRAGAVLKELGISPATRAASGRYQGSLPITPGVRYWATSQPRLRQDFLGIQFYGEGAAEASRYGERLRRAGFRPRTPQTGQLTFAKPAPFSPNGSIDTDAIRSIRRDLDDILRERTVTAGKDEAETSPSFRTFMLASPLAKVDLHFAARSADWRAADF